MQTYRDTRTGFLWIRNLWRSDVPWVSPVASRHDTEGQTLIYDIIRPEERSWNGLLILIIAAGGITFASIWLNMKIMAKKKEETDDKPKEEVVTYSVRKAMYDDKSRPAAPQIDPAQMGKMMKIILPVIMVIFTLMMTSALAVYIIFSSLFTTLFTLAKNPIINMLIARGEKKRGDMTVEDDPNKINPHAKFFKTKRK